MRNGVSEKKELMKKIEAEEKHEEEVRLQAGGRLLQELGLLGKMRNIFE